MNCVSSVLREAQLLRSATGSDVSLRKVVSNSVRVLLMFVGLLLALSAVGQTTEAFEQLQEAARLRPNDLHIAAALASFYTYQGKLDEAIGRVLAAPTLLLERERKGQRSTDDIRPSIIDLSAVSAADDDPRPRLCATVATTGRGLRPTELVAAMFPALDPVDTAARVLRTRQLIERDGSRHELLPVDTDAARVPAGCA